MADWCEFELSLTVGLRRLARWSSGRARRDRCEVDRCRCDRCEVDRSRFGCWKSFVLSLVGRIGALGGWKSFFLSLVVLSLSRSFFDCFFFVLSLSLACCVFCFFSPSLCVLQATEMN